MIGSRLPLGQIERCLNQAYIYYNQMTNFEYKNLRKWMKLSTNCDIGAFGDDISLVYLLL